MAAKPEYQKRHTKAQSAYTNSFLMSGSPIPIYSPPTPNTHQSNYDILGIISPAHSTFMASNNSRLPLPKANPGSSFVDTANNDRTMTNLDLTIEHFNKVSERSDIQTSLIESHFTKNNFAINISNIKNSKFSFDVEDQLTYLYTLKLALILENRDSSNRSSIWYQKRGSAQSISYPLMTDSSLAFNNSSKPVPSAKNMFYRPLSQSEDKRASFSVINVRHTSTDFGKNVSQNYNQSPNLGNSKSTTIGINGPNTTANIPNVPIPPKSRKFNVNEGLSTLKNLTNSMFKFVNTGKNKTKESDIESGKNAEKLKLKPKLVKKHANQGEVPDDGQNGPDSTGFENPYKSNLQFQSTHRLVLEHFRSRLKKSMSDKALHILTKTILSNIRDMLNKDGYIARASKDPDLQPFLMDIVQITVSSISEKGVANNETLKSLTLHQLIPIIDILDLSITDFFKSHPEAIKFSQRMQILLQNQAKIYFERLMHLSTASESFETQTTAQRHSKISTHEINQTNSFSKISDLEDGYSTTWIQLAFNIIPAIHQSTLTNLQDSSTEAELNLDIKRCLELTLNDQSFTEKRADFTVEHAYELWKQREITSLNQLLEVQLHREIIKNKDSASSVKPFLKLNINTPEFSFIPDNVFGHYRNLIKHAAYIDILAPFITKNDTNYTISHEANKILKLAAMTWRIGGAFQVTCYLDIIKDLWINEGLYVQYLYDAIGKVFKMTGLISLDLWTVSQKNYLENVCKAIELKMISILEDIIENPFMIDSDQAEIVMKLYKAIDSILPAADSIKTTQQQPRALVRPCVYNKQVEQLVFSSIEYLYHQIYEQVGLRLQFDPIRINDYIGVIGKIKTVNGNLVKAFAKMADGVYAMDLDIPGLVLHLLVKLFLSDLKKLFDPKNKELEESDIEIELELYHESKALVDICTEKGFTVEDSGGLEQILRSSTWRWLDVLEQESSEWMRNALLVDKINEASYNAYYSSSVLDILTCFSQQISVISEIKWPNAKCYGEFLNRFCKIMCKIFEKYSIAIEQQFLDIQKKLMNPSEPTVNFHENMETPEFHSVDCALDEAVHFSLETCVKLNNLYIAINQLQEMVSRLQVYEVAEKLGGDARFSQRPVQNGSKHVYIVEVVNAEEVELLENSKKLFNQANINVYVKLKMFFQEKASGKKTVTIGKTRPVPLNAMNPRWEEEFRIEPHPFLGSISNQKNSSEIHYPIGVEICSQSILNSLVKKSTTHGRGVFYLAQSLLTNSGNSVEIKVDLEPCGRLHLRVSMESPVDDMEYYVERMFNKLKRALRDLQQRIVEQASAAIRSHILRTLILARDSNRKMLSEKNQNCSPANKSEVGILPQDNTTPKTKEILVQTFSFLRKNLKRANSYKIYKQEWEDDLIPVVNYLERNLHILYNCLYDEVALGVILQIWKEILHTFEDFILPQLRGNKTIAEMQLTYTNLDHVYNLIEFFKWFLNGGDDKDGIPMNLLENSWYLGLIYVRDNYFNSTQDLEILYLKALKMPTTIAMSRTNSNLQDNKNVLQKNEPRLLNLRMDTHIHDILAMNKNKDGNLQKKCLPSISFDSNSITSSLQDSSNKHNGTKPTGTKGTAGNFSSQINLSTQDNPETKEPKSRYTILSFLGSKKPRDSDTATENSKTQQSDAPKRYTLLGFKKLSLDVTSLEVDPSNNQAQPQPQPQPKLKNSESSNFLKSNEPVNTKDGQKANVSQSLRVCRSDEFTAQELLELRKPEIILRMLRLKDDKRALNFVKKQLEIREKQLDFDSNIANAKPKSNSNLEKA